MSTHNLIQRRRHVPDKLVVNLHLVRRLQPRTLSQLLTPRRQIPSNQVFLELGVFPYVEEDDDVVIRVRVPSFTRQFDVSSDHQITLDQLDPIHRDLLRLGIRLDFFRSELGETILDPSQILSKLFTQGGPIRRRLVLDPDLFFIRGEGDAEDVEFLLNVPFQRLDIGEILGIVVEDDDLLERL